MSDFTFPEARFVGAGASSDEVDVLRREFNASDVTVQRSLDGFWASQSVGGLRDSLARCRLDGRFVATSENAQSSESTLEDDSDDSDAETVENDSVPENDESDVTHNDEG